MNGKPFRPEVLDKLWEEAAKENGLKLPATTPRYWPRPICPQPLFPIRAFCNSRDLHDLLSAQLSGP